MKPIQLFCLPYAGGGPDFFQVLRDHLDARITLDAFEYAGHGKRIKEPCYPDCAALADDAQAYINTRLLPDHELMLFGYSMGTIGVYEMIARGMLLNIYANITTAQCADPKPARMGHGEVQPRRVFKIRLAVFALCNAKRLRKRHGFLRSIQARKADKPLRAAVISRCFINYIYARAVGFHFALP